jgi:hypothetical protein
MMGGLSGTTLSAPALHTTDIHKLYNDKHKHAHTHICTQTCGRCPNAQALENVGPCALSPLHRKLAFIPAGFSASLTEQQIEIKMESH